MKCSAYLFVDDNYAQAVGETYSQKLESTYGLSYELSYIEAINQIGQRLLKVYPSDIPVTFKIIKQPVFNAFSVPGGYIYVTEVMMNTLDRYATEDELAFVLGHELGHNNNEHFLKTSEKLFTSSLIINTAAKNSDYRDKLVSLANVLINRGYGFDKEHEADKSGFNAIVKAGFNPGAGAAFFYRLKAYGTGESGDALYNFVYPHPKTETRIEKQLQYLNEYSLGKVKVGNNGSTIYLNNIPVIELMSPDQSLNQIRVAYIAGNLAEVAHAGKLDAISASQDEKRLIFGDKTLMVITDTDNSVSSILSGIHFALAAN